MLPEKWVKFSDFGRKILRAVTPWQWLVSVSHLRSAVVISSTASLVLKRLSSLARWVAVSRAWSPDDTHDCVCVCVCERERDREREREKEKEGLTL